MKNKEIENIIIYSNLMDSIAEIEKGLMAEIGRFSLERHELSGDRVESYSMHTRDRLDHYEGVAQDAKEKLDILVKFKQDFFQ